MKKWADFLISQVTYDLDHKISIIKQHHDTGSGITSGIEIDRLTLFSDIQNGLSYATIYTSGSTWKLGNYINAFRIGGDYFLRIDKNEVELDYLGDLSKVEFVDDEIDSTLEQKPVEQKPVEQKPVEQKPVDLLNKNLLNKNLLNKNLLNKNLLNKNLLNKNMFKILKNMKKIIF